MRKKKIMLPAHFEVCDCGLHGCIIFSDGTRGEDNLTQQGALFALEEALREERVHNVEFQEVEKQIYNSPLPPSLESVVVETLLVLALIKPVKKKDCESRRRGPAWVDQICLN